MYYHSRPMLYVEYGKVVPPPKSEYDELDLNMYGWVGHHCGYCPQIWLARSRSSITGYRNNILMKKSKINAFQSKRRQNNKINNNDVLFEFDVIKGFPLSYNHWEMIMTCAMMNKGIEVQNKAMEQTLNDSLTYYEQGEKIDREIQDWVDAGKNLDVYLKKFVFKEEDQVVVPSLNLKSAKKIICHNEKQKKKLRKMGFIEDRIQIKNVKPLKF